jgi:serine/threonine protein kinase
MELMDGPLDMAKLDGTLKSILLMFVARSLAYLHSKGIVHLDLKPANILLLAQRAKLGDFGSAKLFGLSVTQTSIALTQSYASPDALNGKDPDPAMDVYSFAVIAYELATGQPAFDPKLPPGPLMMAILGGKVPQVPSSVAPVLRQVIERGWALDPKQRPTMAEVCETLAGASWCVFPGADAKKVAEAELELPIDATASPATVALRVEKLEAENSALKSEVAQIPALKAENAQIPALKAEVAKLKAENAGLKAEIG